MKQQHNCGTCNKQFATEQEYLAHLCTTGFAPTDVAHQDALTNGQFSMQSANALKRGATKVI